MKIQAKTLTLSLCVTLLVLFGGFFSYQWWFVQKPLQSMVEATPHVKLTHMNVQPTQVEIKLTTDSSFSFVYHLQPLKQKMQTVIGQRKLHLKLKDHTSPELNQAWSQMMFGVQEGISLNKYTEIPKVIDEIAKTKQIQAEYFMDDEFIYIKLYKDQHYLYQSLPLHIKEGEVKQYE